MKFLSTLGASLVLGISSVQVQAWRDSFSNDSPWLNARNIDTLDHHYNFGDLYTRNYGSPHNDKTYTFTKRDLEDLSESVDILARDLQTLLAVREPRGLYRRAGSNKGSPKGSPQGGSPDPPESPSPPGSRGKDVREKTPPPIHKDYVSVKQGHGLYTDFTREPGIETTGLNGCTAIAVIGQHGATLGHKSPPHAGALNDVAKFTTQYHIGNKATILAPAVKGKIDGPDEIQEIKAALAKAGIKTFDVQTYEYDERNLRETWMAIDNYGKITTGNNGY